MAQHTQYRPHIRQAAFWMMVLVITTAFFGMIKPFLLTVFWSVLLAVVFHRANRIIRWRLGGRENLAALLTVLLVAIMVVLPVMLVFSALVNQSMAIYKEIETGDWNPAQFIDVFEQQMPRLGDWLSKIGYTPDRLKEDLSALVLRMTRLLAEQALAYTQNAIVVVGEFFVMLYVLFFFLRDGSSIIRAIVHALPFGNRWEYVVINRFASVSRATLKGTLIVAVVQGSIGGIMFGLLGIKGYIFWGVIMILLSLLPVGGSAIVWFPAAIYLFITGQAGPAIVLTVVGSLGIGLIDNVLRPILVGRDTQMPDYMVLISTLGGITWFGLTGFVLGPVIAALFMTCWEVAGRDFGGSDA